MRVCDATLVNTFGHCSSDRVKVYCGHTTPAIGCGRHVKYDIQSVYAGHKIRESASA